MVREGPPTRIIASEHVQVWMTRGRSRIISPWKNHMQN